MGEIHRIYEQTVDYGFLPRFLRSFLRFSRASIFNKSSLETLSIWRMALSNRSNSVLPGTFGAGNGFIVCPSPQL